MTTQRVEREKTSRGATSQVALTVVVVGDVGMDSMFLCLSRCENVYQGLRILFVRIKKRFI